MKPLKQIMSLVLATAIFVFFNLSVYILVTRRCANNFGDAGQGAMIDAENYLPFDEDSRIVKLDSSVRLTGDLPVLDGATALLSVYSAFVNAVYPEGACKFDGTYPIVSEFYAIYRADNENENIPLLRDWILSEEGQNIIEDSGYVGIE